LPACLLTLTKYVSTSLVTPQLSHVSSAII